MYYNSATTAVVEAKADLGDPLVFSVSVRRFVPGGDSRFLDAVLVALNQTSRGEPWYVSTTQLQLASIELCVWCRRSATFRLTIDARTPRRLLARADAPAPTLERGRSLSPRVPRLKARAVAWHRRSCEELGRTIYALTEAQFLLFGGGFDENVDGISWPAGLKVISFGGDFDQDVEGVRWPPALEEIAFGHNFDQSVENIAWPASLLYLTLGYCFNYPIEGVSWPPRLEALRLGNCFDQPIARVAWPASLQQLFLGHCFDQPIAEVRWPTSLQVLNFGWNFNQTLDRDWPRSLRRLTLNRSFTHPLHGLGRWMPNLEELELLVDSDDYVASLADVAWPVSLQKLALPKRLWDRNAAAMPKGVELDVFYG